MLTYIFFPDIRFRNNGLDSIEVQDNGGGLSPENYDSIGETSIPA